MASPRTSSFQSIFLLLLLILVSPLSALQVDTLKDTMEKFYGKDPKLSKDVSRIVNASHFSRLLNLLDDPRVSPKVVHGGERDENKLYIAPTLVCDAPMDAPLMSEEIFGPILPIIKVISCDPLQIQCEHGFFSIQSIGTET